MQVDASGIYQPEQPRTFLQEDEEEMIFDLLVAGAFALATLRRFGGMDSYFPLHPELGVELGFRFSLQATSPRREKYYRTLVTTLWYCAHECRDEPQSVATALPAPILEESATKDASRELLPHMFQKGEAEDIQEYCTHAKTAVQI